ncbi:MAG: PD40 domain-containing protein, partial [Chrysiogenetes bacterium]|nr:PD40 domain-containing protein [Chrysiogenetes bacterium]
MNTLKNYALTLVVILLAACQSGPRAPANLLVPVGEDLAAVNDNVNVQGTLRVYEQSDIDGALGECVAEAFGTKAGSNYSFNLPDLSFGDYAVRIYYTGTRDGVSSLLLAADCPEFTHAIDGSECDIDFSVLSVLGHQALFEARTDPLDPDTATETFGVEDCEGNVLNISEAPIAATCKESLFDCDRNNTTNLQEAQDPNGSFFSLGVTTAGNGVSDFAQVSGDSRYVTFHTTANNLSDDDLNNAEDVYVLDRQTGVLDAVTSGFPGEDANGPSMQSSVDDEGRYVAFSSFASNLAPGDTNNMADIFVRDREQRVVRLISQGMSAMPADGNSFNPSISLDGRFVAFESDATNLVTGDTNGVSDIFVADRDVSDDGFFDEEGDTKIVRVSVSAAGAQADGASRNPSISGLGRHVAFESDATNLIVGDTNARTDIFVHDRDCDESMAANPCVDGLSGDEIFDQAGRIRTIRVSVTEAGAELVAASTNPDLSQSWDGMEDGRFVVFETMDNTIKTLLPVFDFLGFGNGGTNYMFTLAYAPVKPGSVRVTAPMGMCVDNGMGMLLGSGECMGGTVNYMTGDINVNFSVAQDMSDDLFGIYALEFNDLNPRMDVYLHDRDCDPMAPFDGCQFGANGVFDETGLNRTLLMSHSFDALDGFIASNGFSHNPAVSGDGKIVAFDSDADNLIPLVGDFNAERDVFARVRSLGGVDQIVTMSGEMPLTCRVSQKNLDGGNGESKNPAVNLLGDRIAYETDATNLASDMDTAFDTNGKVDIVRAEVMVNTTDCISEFVTSSLRATAGRNNNVISQATKDSTGAA